MAQLMRVMNSLDSSIVTKKQFNGKLDRNENQTSDQTQGCQPENFTKTLVMTRKCD